MVQRDIVIPDIARVRQSKGSECRHAGKCLGSLAQKVGDNAQASRVCAILVGAAGVTRGWWCVPNVHEVVGDCLCC